MATLSPDQSAATDAPIRPFQLEIDQADVDDLRRRIQATRWPSKELVDDRSQGVQLATMQELAQATGRTSTTSDVLRRG